MTKLRQLTPNETLFIGGEKPNVYQHTGGLILLDASDRPDFCFESFKAHYAKRLESVPHFRWKLHEVPFNLDLPYWVEDENYSIDHHVRRIAVPSPGDREALAELAAYLYSKHLDRNRPLWETWFIEGLPNRQFALLHKLHHCIMDGEGALRVGQLTTDLEPDAEQRPVDPEISQAEPGAVPGMLQQYYNLARNYAGLPARTTRQIVGLAGPMLRQRMSGKEPDRPRPRAPVAHFNADIGSERAIVFGSLPLADIKATKDHFNVTVNDLVMALIGGSLRQYLLAMGELPPESLVAAIALSTRTDADDKFSNKLTSATIALATDMADPVARLRAIAEQTSEAKERARSGRASAFELINLLPPVLVGALMGAMEPEQMPGVMGTNVLVSNVRGLGQRIYIAGARQVAMYPISLISPGMAINITCVGNVDMLDVGITLEPSLFPERWSLIRGLEDALAEYLKLAGKRARRKPVAATKRKARKTAHPRSRAATSPARKAATKRKAARGKKRPASRKRS